MTKTIKKITAVIAVMGMLLISGCSDKTFTGNIEVTAGGMGITDASTTSTAYGELYSFTEGIVYLKDAFFAVYDSSGKAIDGIGYGTDDEGKAAISNIPVTSDQDKVYLCQVKAPEGYEYSSSWTRNSQGYAGASVCLEDGMTRSINVLDQAKHFNVEVIMTDASDDPLSEAVFGLYSTEDIVLDSMTIPAGALVGLETTDAAGKAVFSTILPVTQKYLLKELDASEEYVSDDTVYEIDHSEFLKSSEIEKTYTIRITK